MLQQHLHSAAGKICSMTDEVNQYLSTNLHQKNSLNLVYCSIMWQQCVNHNRAENYTALWEWLHPEFWIDAPASGLSPEPRHGNTPLPSSIIPHFQIPVWSFAIRACILALSASTQATERCPTTDIVNYWLNCQGVVLKASPHPLSHVKDNFVVLALTFISKLLALASKTLSSTTHGLSCGFMGGNWKVPRQSCWEEI
jgi:hypothetical protein